MIPRVGDNKSVKPSPLIATFSCAECNNANMIIVQIDNDLHILCSSCGNICNFQEAVNQLEAAKKELGEF